MMKLKEIAVQGPHANADEPMASCVGKKSAYPSGSIRCCLKG